MLHALRCCWQPIVGCLLLVGTLQAEPVPLKVKVIDASTRTPVPARLYLQGSDGVWHFAEGNGAQRYEKQNWINAESIESHTCVLSSGGTYHVEPGTYRLTAERGKEYRPTEIEIEVATGGSEQVVPLHRWINLAERGWYSGETHLHRTIDELRTVILAEDLNVAFPLSYWETRAGAPPRRETRTSKARFHRASCMSIGRTSSGPAIPSTRSFRSVSSDTPWEHSSC